MGDLIQLKRGLSTSWATKNLVLQAGEPGYETNTGKMKIGDGTTAWNNLDYSSGDTPLILDAPPTTSTVSPVGRIAIWHDANATDQTHANHLYHMAYITTSESATLYHWEECVLVSMGNVAGGYARLDANGIVGSNQLPLAAANAKGAIMVTSRTDGLRINGSYLQIANSNHEDIDAKTQEFRPITPNNLDYAVRSVLPNVTVIPSATTAYSLLDASATTNNHCKCYSHAPTSASVYTLPAVTGAAVAHDIILDVQFSTNVLTYEFQDSAGTTLSPLPMSGYIVNGTIVRFLCTYSAQSSKWAIMPVILNPEVA